MVAPKIPDEEPDEVVQAAVLAHILDEHPTQLCHCDLIRELSNDPDDKSACDDINRAVRDLVKAGLLRKHGEYFLPTRPALHFHRLPWL